MSGKTRDEEKCKQMADEKEKDAPKEDVILIAEVRAYLVSGETIDLLPFKHEEDVRAEINKFIEDWSKTGFLLKENFLYPWEQVKLIEVASVKAMSHAEAKPYLEEWQRDSDAQKAFWKTRKAKAKEGEKEEGGSA